MADFKRLGVFLVSVYEDMDGARWTKIFAAALSLIAFARILHAHLLMPLRRCGDEYGYIFFRFDDLATGLSGIRAPGFPLVVKFYELLFPHFGFWPTFQVALFSVAVFWLYFNLISGRVRPVGAFAICAPLFLSGPAIAGAPFICSDGTAGIFTVAVAAALITARRTGGMLPMAVLGLLSTMTVLVRPAFLPLLPLLFVAWMCMSPPASQVRSLRARLRELVLLGLVLVAPLGLFVGYRYVLTGHLGLTALGQLLLGGHATAYLKAEHVANLDGDVKEIAERILDRRARLAAPCALAADENVGTRFPDDWLEGTRFEHLCYGAWYHTAMLAAFEFGTGKLPLADTGGTYTPWPPSGPSTQHPPSAAPTFGDPEPWSWGGDRWLHEEVLAGKNGRPGVYFDSLLGRYNKVILAKERELYIRWLAGETVIAGEEFAAYLTDSRAVRWGGMVSVLLAAASIAFLLLCRRRARLYFRTLFGPLNVGERVVLMLGIGLPVLTTGLTISIVYVYARYLDAPAVFVPAIAGLVCLRLMDALCMSLNPRASPDRGTDPSGSV
ncbi:MAG: hypothetical protein COW30_15180 [Rhodospirillales bacterium CG15_BIG_FIL_POST_REV_8_21_14_020_66_15]|nr:MAG: hypothetical protein COW30_15180 [Rhodospirillales bacterium CG15_BIG_FIL_POST_REV_8_21_14_020_66_15]